MDLEQETVTVFRGDYDQFAPCFSDTAYRQ